MDKLSTYYRAFLEYRKNTKEKKECVALVNSIKSSNTNNDLIEVTKHIFTVDEDWIIAIEEGLIHVEKAIAEERQFIRVNGEVVPIEKAKRVSKDSVSHLSRHSNLITRKVDLENLVPDQIYTIEKLSDYAVYENRFLYMLLCYLKDFIALRYDKILELSNTYIGNMKMKKVISSRNQKIIYEANLYEEKKNDKFFKENNKSKNIIERIDLLLKTVLMYLQTPLMQEVGKVALLKPPITKTNVLKMNKNFKGAVALYEYITSYDKVGYTIEKQVKSITPFIDDIGDEMSEIIALSSFLTYEHGNGIAKLLKENYDKEEILRKEQENLKYQEQLKALRKRVKESGLGMEEYMLMLEKRNKQLEKDSAQLVIAKKEIEELKNNIISLNLQIDDLKTQIINLKQTIQEKEQEIIYLNKKYIEDMARIKEEHRIEIANLTESYESKIEEIHNSYQTQIEEMKDKYEEEIKNLKESYQLQIKELTDRYEEEIRVLNENYQKQIFELTTSYEDKISQLIYKYEIQIKELTELYEKEKADLIKKYDNEISSLKEEHSKEIIDITKKHEENIALLNVEINSLKESFKKLKEENKENIKKLNEKIKQNKVLETKNESIVEVYGTEKKVLLAEINVLRTNHGKENLPDDFTTRENFNELEEELIAFKKIFKSQWQRTKKRILKETKKEMGYKKVKKEKK